MPTSTYNLGAAVIRIEGVDTCIKLDATKVEMELVEVVSQHSYDGFLVPDYEMLIGRSVILRCEFTEDMVISASDSADPVVVKKVADMVRVIRLKKGERDD